MANITIPDCGKGINKDLLSSELADGMWSGGLNFRFRNGFAEAVGGIARKFDFISKTWLWMQMFTTVSPTVNRWMVGFDDLGVYGVKGSGTQDISPYVDPVTVTAATALASVGTYTTATAHNLTSGDVITTTGFTAGAYNRVAQTVTVLSATSFSIPLASTPAAATVVGAYTIDSSTTILDYLAAGENSCTGGVLNGVVIFSTYTSGWWYWNGSVSTRMTRFGSTFYNARSTRPFQYWIVQVGTYDRATGIDYPYRVAWSDRAEPGSIPTTFIAASTNDAGQVDKAETPGVMVDQCAWGEVNILYKEDSRIAMRYIGGNDVFSFDVLPGSDGLYAVNCAVNTPKGQVFLTKSLDVKIHTGGVAESIANGVVKDWIKATLNTSSAQTPFLLVNPTVSEVWVCIPSTASAYCDMVAMWNWDSNTWGIRYISVGFRAGCVGILPGAQHLPDEERLIIGGQNAQIGITESGITEFGSALTRSLERTGMHLGDRNRFKTLQRSRWNIDATAGDTAQIYHGSSKTADGTVTYVSPVTYTVGTTDSADAVAPSGRFIAEKLETTAYPFKVRSQDLDVTPGGLY
jgi:hypothetical protein